MCSYTPDSDSDLGATMNPHVARSDFASCGTRLVRAKLFRRVHRLCCLSLHKYIMPMDSDFFKLSPQFHRLVGLYQNLASASCFKIFSNISNNTHCMRDRPNNSAEGYLIIF